MKYSVRLTKDGKFHSYLESNKKTSWSLQTAMKHGIEYVQANYSKDFDVDFDLEDEFGIFKPNPFKGRLPLNAKYEVLTYHRNPTKAEIKFGHGATHYVDFDVELCCIEYRGKFYPRDILVSPYDGLRYYH